MRLKKVVVLGASMVALALVITSCGSTGGPSSSSSSPKASVTVGALNFPESAIIAQIYGQALKGKGYTVSYKLNLGSREVVEPALERGDINLFPDYAATELEFQNKGKGEATPDAAATVTKLNTYLTSKGLKALTPSPAVDQNAFAVLKSGKYGSKTKLSDLSSVASQMTLGGPAECPTRPFCEAGLTSKYGLRFKAFKALDAGGPLTKAALDKGDIDLGLIFSSDSAYSTGKYVQLQDDMHLQNADNVVPLIKASLANDEVTSLLNEIDGKLTTDDLIKLNKSSDVDKQDPDVIAKKWLTDHGYSTGS
jgi:osmoprotectant transport system substrate-binding protein